MRTKQIEVLHLGYELKDPPWMNITELHNLLQGRLCQRIRADKYGCNSNRAYLN